MAPGFATALIICAAVSGAGAQLLDRIVAVVDGAPITQSDVNAAIELGLVPLGGGDRTAAAQRAIRMYDAPATIRALTAVVTAPPSGAVARGFVEYQHTRLGR